MSVKALEYAEQQLGVHEVWLEAKHLSDQLAGTLTRVDKARSEKRRLEDKIQDAEAQLLTEKRGKHPDMSEAQFKSMYTAFRRQDPMLIQLREELNQTLGELDASQSVADVLKGDIRIRTARLEELGGYLQYLAVIKAEQTTKTIQPNQQNQSTDQTEGQT